MSDEQKKAIVLQYYEEFDNGNLDKIEDMLAPHYVAHIPGSPEPLNRETFKEFGLMFRSAFPDIRHSFEDVIVDDDKVVTRGSFAGTHQGKLQGLPPTNKRVTVSFIHVDRIENDKIAEHWGEADLMGMLRQLGAIPVPMPLVWQGLKIGAIVFTVLCIIGLLIYRY
ncbi:ester cyclase [Aerosakkonema funiforme]|uniref:Ester cyclase n=1 Tax=Aerosakkonema funiforme FACHB-1375 TaxID=2949571 RepID=A0A926VIK8_9CYAN|nr:ester cyclase [Aerosakkonema funiforme]MBD2184453.1 ester cyclase [Aerosakkonema funiforme FACHB-1375]